LRCNVGRRTTDVEGTECQLCSRLTDRLCGNNTYSLTQLNAFAGSQVASVTGCTYATLGLTGQYGADFYTFDTSGFNSVSYFFGNILVSSNNQLVRFRMIYIVQRCTP